MTFKGQVAGALERAAHVPTSIPTGTDDEGWLSNTGRRSAGKTAHEALQFFRDWHTLWHSGSARRTVRIDSVQNVNSGHNDYQERLKKSAKADSLRFLRR